MHPVANSGWLGFARGAMAIEPWGNPGTPKPATYYRRQGRAGVTGLLVLVALAAGAAGGFWIPGRLGLDSTSAGAGGGGEGAAGDDEQWYTCGMHPNVLQKTPGDCPICQMKLTPLKKDSGDGDSGGSNERKVLYWRAPMDPNVLSDKPGKSPMGMDLVPVYADDQESASSHTIRIDPVTIQNMGIRSTVVKRAPLIKTIRTVGRVDYDEQRVTFVDTKFNGWIESLYVDETGMPVAKDERLFDVYSPELYAAQVEYLAAVENLPLLEGSTFAPAREEAVKMVDAAVTKLRYLDVSDGQIAALRDTGKIEKTLTIHSPSEGIVTEKMALEDMYVKPGMRLYTIADLSQVWVYVDVYEYQIPWVGVGQSASMTLPYVSGREFTGKVVYIYPYLEERTRVIKVRLEFDNPNLELKPGMYANIRLESRLQRDALLIPREAYIDSGTRQVAFVDRGDGKFSPRDIQVGVEGEAGMVEVLYGLDEGEEVVTSGQFMLDAESKLKEAVAKMMEAERAKTTKRTPESPTQMASGHDHAAMEGMPADAAYACPMEEHPDEADPAEQGAYYSANPGKCPRCGMKLKPLDELEWVRVRRAAEGGDVAYTCPEHQHVFADQGGQCPRCGKKLMPFKVMYTCPDAEHADAVSASSGNCSRCGRGLAAFRGIWLDPSMAGDNVPGEPGLADAAAYRCSVHPLVHSDSPGQCTICGATLESAEAASKPSEALQIPPDAKYTCPMKRCGYFSTAPGTCPKCDMDLKPIEQVGWAKDLNARGASAGSKQQFFCPMHPKKERSDRPGTCSICGMQLVNREAFHQAQDAPAQVAAQMDYILEHYLELQKLLASDRKSGMARHALGLASASEELVKHLEDPTVKLPPEMKSAARRLHAAALTITGARLDEDRVSFVELSAAVEALIQHARPSHQRWPKLYIYHCPMSKGDWLQASESKANPYYGFKMLKCGELKGVK
ncbi:MAG: efflux RND transporter periplasmic adaptor subunit [Phycisphaerae bacterium]